MKHSMIKCTLATALTIGLAACGGGGGGNNSGGGSGDVKKFDGNDTTAEPTETLIFTD